MRITIKKINKDLLTEELSRKLMLEISKKSCALEVEVLDQN